QAAGRPALVQAGEERLDVLGADLRHKQLAQPGLDVDADGAVVHLPGGRLDGRAGDVLQPVVEVVGHGDALGVRAAPPGLLLDLAHAGEDVALGLRRHLPVLRLAVGPDANDNAGDPAALALREEDRALAAAAPTLLAHLKTPQWCR